LSWTLWLVAAAATAPNAAMAGPLIVSSSSSAAVATSRGDGQGPGDITIDGGGSISLNSGVALTIDSNNTALINGTIEHNAETGATAVLVSTRDANGAPRTLTSGFTLGGSIVIDGPRERDLPTTDARNTAVRFEGGGVFKGNIDVPVNSSILVGGNNSFGFNVDSVIDGNVAVGANISLNGANAVGARFAGGITGNVSIGGQTAPSGANGIGWIFGGDIGGFLVLNGSIGTGAQASFDTNGRLIDPAPGGSALRISGGVARGIAFDGNGLTETQEATIAPAANAPADTLLYSEAGNATTLVIAPVGAGGDLVFGQLDATIDSNRNSLLMRGLIQSNTTEEGRAASAILISGSENGQPARTTRFLGEVWNDRGNIDSVAIDASATGIRIGERTVIPGFINSGEILVRAQDQTEDGSTGAPGQGGGDAFGLMIARTATIGRFVNLGTFNIDARGARFSAYGMVDESGTLASFANTGTFVASIRPGSTGRAIGLDAGRSTRNMTFLNTGTFGGSVRLGSGSDTLTSTGGSMTGDIATGGGNDTVAFDGTTVTGNVDLGAGNHTVTVRNKTTLRGGIGRGAGTAQVTVADSSIFVPGGRVISATNASFTGASSLDFAIDGKTATTPLLGATGTVVIDPTVKIFTRLAGLVRDSTTFILISAGTLQMGVPVSQIQSATGSFIYTLGTRVSPTNRNVILLDVTRKTAMQLGLGPIMGATYENALTALGNDNELFSILASQPDRPGFESVLQQLTPDTSDATLIAALNTQNMAHGVIRHRLAGIPRTLGPNPTGEYSSFWIQQLGSYGSRDAEGETKGYKLYAAGLAAGFDGQSADNLKLGASLSRTWSLPDEKGTADRPLRVIATQLDVYARHQNGPNFTQGILGGAYDEYRSRRRVVVGDVIREPVGKWSGYHVGGALDTGTTARLSSVKLSPYARVAFVRAYEKGYTESGGGAGVDLAYDGRNLNSLRAGFGFVAARRFELFQDSGVEAEFRGDYAREFGDSGAKVSARFASGGSTFVTTGVGTGKNIFTGGLSVGVRDIFTAFTVDYDAAFTGDYLGHTISATFRFRF
jgi:uncharacterized protein with beta-barrel porin domain